MNPRPVVSVILPFYNNADTVCRAMRSVLGQTERAIEVIAIDDGSTDGSFQRVEAMRDPRIRLYRNDLNCGVAATRNRGLDLAQGEFVAMMDADDVSRPQRLEWTLAALRRYPEAGICGGWMRMCRHGVVPFTLRVPCSSQGVRAMSLYGASFLYASVLFKRDLANHANLRYDTSLKTGSDAHFGRRLLCHTSGINIPKVVYEYRWNPKGLTANAHPSEKKGYAEWRRADLEKTLGRPVGADELMLHTSIGRGEGALNPTELGRRHDWMVCLIEANALSSAFDEAGLRECSGLLWFRNCRNSAHLGAAAWRIWHRSSLSRFYKPHRAEWFGFAGSMIMSLTRRGVVPIRGAGRR